MDGSDLLEIFGESLNDHQTYPLMIFITTFKITKIEEDKNQKISLST